MNKQMRPWRRLGGMLLLGMAVGLVHLALVGLVQASAQPGERRTALRVRLLEEASAIAATATAAAAPDPMGSPAATPATLLPPQPMPAPTETPARDRDAMTATQRHLDETGRRAPPTPSPQESAAAPDLSEVTPMADTATPAPAGEATALDTVLLAAAEPRPARGERRGNAAPPGAAAPMAQDTSVRMPAPVTLRYSMRRGPLSGDAELVWQHDGQRYSLDLSAKMPLLGTIYEQHSRGHLDDTGLAPARYTEKRLSKPERAVNFVRPEDGSPGTVAFSTRSTRLPLVRGMQDRLSWMVQLAARLQAWPGELQAGQRIEMAVAGPSGDVQLWHFLAKDSVGAGDDRVWRWLREADQPHETQAEVWVSARRAHFPVRVRLTESQGEPLDLVVR